MRTRMAGLLAVLAMAIVVGAQSLATISGVVTDDHGAVVSGATVRLLSGSTEIRRTVSNGRGEYAFHVPPGDYTIVSELRGFTAARRQVRVTAGQRTTVGLVMRHASLADVSSLEAAAALAPVAGVAGNASISGRYRTDFNTEAYDRVDENTWTAAARRPLSTFSVDVDTASYANVRRFLNSGQLPPADAVRIEELLNYFAYDYRQPAADAPFSVTTEVAPCPWNDKHRLALIGLQGRRIDGEALPPRNLVFLIDVSGSMDHPQKLPLVKSALSMLAGHLTARDRVAIVVYAGASGLVLPSTPGDDREAILGALADLEAGGSTNGGEGLVLAYRVAEAHLVKGGVNRVVLATDGDFNVGVTSQGDLVRLIEEKRERGVSLSVLGFGMGNLKDSTLEKLADKGNGNYAYIDSMEEAHKVLVQNAGGTLVTIAKDVKIQVEFNPRHVTAYRLIGYENRVLQDQDFNDDRKDAGEIGAAHSVTALYEIVPAGVAIELPGIDPLKYQTSAPSGTHSGELMMVKLRYKAPDGDTSRLLEQPVRWHDRATVTPNVGFAAAVVEFGMLLRQSPFKAQASYGQALELARAHRGKDEHGHRAEFIRLMELAHDLNALQTRRN